MALDIKALELTRQEVKAATPFEGNEPGSIDDHQKIADAQLAKTLWGIVDWLDKLSESSWDSMSLGFSNALGELEEALEQAGIKRP